MQIQKDSTKRRILAVARREFCGRGVKRTSMRHIAAAAGMAVGNIYNYFKSKDEIFVEICAPLLAELEALLPGVDAACHKASGGFMPERYQAVVAQRFLHMIKNYRGEFRLLLCEATGTSLESFIDTHADRHVTGVVARLRQYASVRQPSHGTDIPPCLVKAASAMWQSVLKQIVLCEEMTEREALRLIAGCASFGAAGFAQLIETGDSA